MKDLVILSGGPNGFEIADIIERINSCKRTWNLLGFIVPDSKKGQTEEYGYPVLGTCEILEKYPNVSIAPGTAWKKMHDIPTERCVSIIDPSCSAAKNAKIGLGCTFFPNCFIGFNAKIGDYVFSLSGSIINHDDVIGDRVVISSGVVIAGNVKIEADCYLGQSCSIRQNLTIEKSSFIGMGSIVVNDVSPNIVVVGNPAKKLRDNI